MDIGSPTRFRVIDEVFHEPTPTRKQNKLNAKPDDAMVIEEEKILPYRIMVNHIFSKIALY